MSGIVGSDEEAEHERIDRPLNQDVAIHARLAADAPEVGDPEPDQAEEPARRAEGQGLDVVVNVQVPELGCEGRGDLGDRNQHEHARFSGLSLDDWPHLHQRETIEPDVDNAHVRQPEGQVAPVLLVPDGKDRGPCAEDHHGHPARRYERRNTLHNDFKEVHRDHHDEKHDDSWR